jgi:DNA-directed RNA polymerase specialized sigma24 family protein
MGFAAAGALRPESEFEPDELEVDSESALAGIPRRQDFTPEQRLTAIAYGRIFMRSRPWADPAVRWQAKKLLERLRARITAEERAVIELVACRDYRFAEVAKLTGKSVEGLKAAFRTGCDKLDGRRQEPRW